MDIRKILNDMARRGNEAGMDYARRSMPEAFRPAPAPENVQPSQGLQDLLAGKGVSEAPEDAMMSVADPAQIASLKQNALVPDEAEMLAMAKSPMGEAKKASLALGSKGHSPVALGKDIASEATETDYGDEALRKAQEERLTSQSRAIASSGMQDISDALAQLGSGKTQKTSRAAQELMLERGEQPVKNIGEKQANQAKEMDLRTEKERRDPNSDVSRIYRESLKELGIDVGENASAASLEKAMGPIGNIMNAKLARDSKAETARFMAEIKAEKQQEKKDQDFNRYVERQGKDFLKGDSYKAMIKTNDALETINSAINYPSGIKDVASLYSIVKGLDPDSVVRPGEIELSQQANSLWANIKTKMSKLGSNPRVVDQKLLKDMKVYLEAVRLQKLKQVKQNQDAVGKHIERNYGRDAKEYLPQVNPMYDTVEKMSGGAAAPIAEQQAPAQDPKIVAWLEAHKDFKNPKTGQPLSYNDAVTIFKNRLSK